MYVSLAPALLSPLLIVSVHTYVNFVVRLPVHIHCTVGFFYFLLGNLSPKYRSALRAINLVVVVKKLIKDYSMNAVLTPIVNNIKKLVSQHSFSGTS
jgi:hypothetical protein